MLQNALLLIDASYLVRRTYKALTDEPDLTRRADKALGGAYHTCARLLAEFPCSHALAVFDSPGNNWRHRLYPDYKANREPAPIQLVHQLPRLINQLRQRQGLRSIMQSGVEADDVIAAAARSFGDRRDALTRIATQDKDLCALISASVEIYAPFDRETRCEAWVQRKFGVAPSQVQDFLALVGDSSDNVPGVPGIGPVKAAALINEFGSLERILRANEPQTLRVREHADAALLSRELVSFRADTRFDWYQFERPSTPQVAPAQAPAAPIHMSAMSL